MAEKQRIDANDVGSLEDVLGRNDPLLRPSPVRASAQEELDDTAAQLIIELAFLVPKGDQKKFDAFSAKLIAFRDALVAAAEARGRQQAEQARDAHSAQCGKCGTWTCGYCGVSDPDGKWHCEKCWGFGPLAEATKRVTALTQALKDIRANLVMAAQQPDGSIGGGMTAMGCHSLVDAIDAALTGAMK